MASDASWAKILRDYNILKHDFSKSPFLLNAKQIKKSVQNFKETNEKEVRILCKQDTRESRPKVFQDNGLFLLPVRNGVYNIIRGEGYIDIPEIKSQPIKYSSKLPFPLETAEIGNSEMQHLDYAYAVSLVRTFIGDKSLVLTIRGRKYTPEFSFNVNNQIIEVKGVQTEIDGGYEGENKVVLIEAKDSKIDNVVIRQMFYPFKQWKKHTKKSVLTVFFEKDHKNKIYSLWLFKFADPNNYNSIKLVKSKSYTIA